MPLEGACSMREHVPLESRSHLGIGVGVITLTILSPLVLPTDLFLLLGSEIVGDIKGFTDLLRRLALNHVGHGFAANIKKRLNVEVVGGLYLLVSDTALRLIL
jgi:hypothetical protein